VADGSVDVLPRATLCSGESRHKPFCDNQHIKVGFRAPGVAFKLHLSPVTPRLDEPITNEEGPRRH
jgi:CDGSH-type Zn-finger protein